MKYSKLIDVSKKTRNDVIPYYIDLILNDYDDFEIVRVNTLILSKWSNSGLVYIKDKAWKCVNAIRALEILKNAIINRRI